jgi:type I restriction enzyme, R subunit
MDDQRRLRKIVEYIIANNDRKTHSRNFTSMFCTSSVDAVIKYYELFNEFKQQGEHKLKVATIFSYGVNEDDKDANGFFPENSMMEDVPPYGTHTREVLDAAIEDYNEMFGTKYSTRDSESFYNYYKDISKRVKNKEIDVLLVVNMFLTGFDSKTLNTLYVDKNLRYHGLIQAYSRTNRIFNDQKSQGNIVVFRNLKNATDEAITLFSNKEAIEDIIMEPYEDYVEKYNKAVEKLREVAPTVDSVDDLPSEAEELEFVQAFREIIRIKNILSTFSDFDEQQLDLPPQEFEDYKSKYLDIHDKVRNTGKKEKTSILEDVDFELELIHRDEINVMYILKLLAKLKTGSKAQQQKTRKEIVDLLTGELQLRSKRELIEKFIQESLPHIEDVDDIPNVFETFVTEEKQKAIKELSTEENLDQEKLNEVIGEYLFTERKPLPNEIVDMMNVKPKLLERTSLVQRITDRIVKFVETFVNGMGE